MRKAVALPFAALALAAVVAAGCSGNGQTAATASGTATPVPVPTVTCTPPPGEQIQSVFPQNGALSAANLQGVVIAVAPNPLPTNWFFYVTFGPSASTTYPTNIGYLATPVPAPGASAGATPTPLPTPSDTPAFANPIYESASNGIFANASKFTIYVANNNCYPGIALGSFTTSTTDSPTPTPTPTATST